MTLKVNCFFFNKGASPEKYGVYYNKVSFMNKNDDIKNTIPRKLFLSFNKPEYNLSNVDIEGASPIKKFITTRITNPLEPKYNIPKFKEEIQPFIPKFIRDNINIDVMIS